METTKPKLIQDRVRILLLIQFRGRSGSQAARYLVPDDVPLHVVSKKCRPQQQLHIIQITHISTLHPFQSSTMICRRCLLHLARPPHSHRLFSSTPRRTSAEPFTVPATMSPSARGAPDSDLGQKKESVTQRSSVPAGTPLKGLAFFKDKDAPIAMEDAEYP